MAAAKRLVPSSDDRPTRRFDPFRVLSAEERRRHLDAYESWLQARNGELDLEGKTLSRREAYFRDLEGRPVVWPEAIDPQAFSDRFDRRGKPALDARTLWLIAIAKANEAERYGVDLELREFIEGRRPRDDASKIYLFMEELYHSRILMAAAETCGVELEFREPRWTMRSMIHLIRVLPERMRWVLVLCGEVLGSTVFKLLLENCALFEDNPEAAERLHSLVSEIWSDEVLHVAFIRAQLGPLGLRVARALLPMVVDRLMKDVPQLEALGCPKRELMRRVRNGIEIPDRIDWLAPDPVLV